MIGIAVANRCDGCIGFHTKALVDLGVTEQELAEALGVAVCHGWRTVCDVCGEYIKGI